MTDDDQALTGLDLFAVGPDEPALGWAVSTPDQVQAFAAALPFGPAMAQLTQIEAAHWFVRSDRLGQLQLARDWLGAKDRVALALERWVAEEPFQLSVR